MSEKAHAALTDAQRERAARVLREARFSRPKTACPRCGCRSSRVLESRDVTAYGPTFWRRRKCLGCGVHYRTEEVARTVIEPKKKSA